MIHLPYDVLWRTILSFLYNRGNPDFIQLPPTGTLYTYIGTVFESSRMAPNLPTFLSGSC
jgi:hypothetical protein